MLQDSFWQAPPPASNIAQIVSWADNNCSSNVELFASGGTPLNGMLRDMKRYFQTSWSAPDGSVSYTSPLSANDLTGAGINGGTGCRNINVILATDGDESCDSQADAVAAAQDLYQNGVLVSGKTFKIRTHVINFAGGSEVNTDQIAAAGGTTQSYFATNEVQLSQALANIIASAIKPETCDNTDNNCNGCTDEGFAHYCNVQQTCCNWSTQPQRQICLQNYKNSITAANPNGDLTLLPCTTAVQQADPANWLCQNPRESCDNADNNCNGQIDEGVTKCGSPAHCPTAEACGNVQDDDCDGQIDEGCPQCTPSPEICDGCDNDCDGVADDNVSPLPCGLPTPPNCSGQQTCKAPVNVPVGGCIPGGPLNNFNVCSNSPQNEVCDNTDNDCDGIKDDNVPPTSCIAPGAPGGLSYAPPSQCKMGTKACGQQTCVGYVGPSPEVCDGIDNDCDGQVDESVVGVGQACGLNQAPCTPGTTACVGGALVCQGGQGPTPEQCDGIDNDCDGSVDDGQLTDAPMAGMNGCWTVAGNCCQFENLTWCPPPGATCNDVGSLVAPCAKGTLACAGGGGWVCQGSKGPIGESCDGIDNDCNGQIDDGSLCAKPCATSGEFECPGGQKCVQATDSQGNPLPNKYCVPEDSACGADNCASATVKDANGKTLCAPLGTAAEDCVTPPTCVCQGQSGCKEPCFGVTCSGGQVCATSGPKAGQCVPDTCLNTGCPGCGKVCTDNGTCVDNPCTPASCPGQLCKPSDDYLMPVCAPSCAGVECAADEVCNEGTCVKTCSPACAAGQVCDTSSGAPVCVPNQCAPGACPGGGCCDPLTGACGACPCEGFVCPEGQVCSNNNCDDPGAGGAGGSGGSSTSTGTGGLDGAGGGAFGLPTGGGGCNCEVGAGAATPAQGAAGLLALAALALGRRRRRAASSEVEVVR